MAPLFVWLFMQRRCSMVRINGELVDAEGKTVSEILSELGYNEKAVAVELNESILPKCDYSSAVLKDGDSAEVVRFVGGG